MQYVKSLDGVVADRYPYDVGELRADNPNVSFPQFGMDAMDGETLMVYHTYQVIETPAPTYDPATETLAVTAAPSGLMSAVPIWEQVWEVVPA